MSGPSNDEDNSRIPEGHSTQTIANEDGWLVRVMVFSLRFFFVLFVAFARAVVIVADDKIPDSLFNQVVPSVVPSTRSARSRNSNLGSLEAHRVGSTSVPLQAYYIIFIGREVGYTTSSTLMTSLVNGIPNNSSQRFSTFDEALQAYAEAVQHGNVRRVRTAIRPSGHVEFVYEYMSFAAGIRNLDQPHVAPLPLSTTSFPPDLLPPTPCNSEIRVSHTDAAADASVSSVSSVTESSGLVIPADHWTLVNASEASADTVIIANTSTSASANGPSANGPSANGPSANGPSGASSVVTVMLLDSDDDSADSSALVNNSVTSVRSSHSSDVYYTDKRYDLAFAAYIEEEDKNAVNVVGDSSANVS